MAISPKRIYWDACSWIALIQKEKIYEDGVLVEDRETMCKAVIRQAESGRLEILTSALNYAEVCKHPNVRNQGADAIAAFLENEYVLPVNVDRFVGERARELMLSRFAGLKPPDAIHLATAAISNAEEMHTFDEALLKLNGVIDKADGTKLKVCKPDVSAPIPPLLRNLSHDGDAKHDTGAT